MSNGAQGQERHLSMYCYCGGDGGGEPLLVREVSQYRRQNSVLDMKRPQL